MLENKSSTNSGTFFVECNIWSNEIQCSLILFTVLKVNSILNLKSLNRLYTQVRKSQLISQKKVYRYLIS